jgi:fructose-bisphosphate aldolase class II
MALVSMRELLDHAAENHYGIPAFNVNNLEQVQAVMTAADEVGAPVILQASAGARKYAGEPFIKHLIQAAAEQWPHIPLVMHQDHGTSPKVCQGAIDLGFGSVMMDGSLMEDVVYLRRRGYGDAGGSLSEGAQEVYSKKTRQCRNCFA